MNQFQRGAQFNRVNQFSGRDQFNQVNQFSGGGEKVQPGQRSSLPGRVHPPRKARAEPAHCDQSEYPFPCSRPVAPAAGDDILPWQDKSASGRAVRSSTFVEVGYREPANRAGATDAKRR